MAEQLKEGFDLAGGTSLFPLQVAPSQQRLRVNQLPPMQPITLAQSELTAQFRSNFTRSGSVTPPTPERYQPSCPRASRQAPGVKSGQVMPMPLWPSAQEAAMVQALMACCRGIPPSPAGPSL